MPDELIEKDDDRKGGLSPAQRDRLEQLIRHMTPERLKIADAMVFCIEHAEAADEICDCILESISNSDTLLYKKVHLSSDLIKVLLSDLSVHCCALCNALTQLGCVCKWQDKEFSRSTKPGGIGDFRFNDDCT